jgi:protein CpxP
MKRRFAQMFAAGALAAGLAMAQTQAPAPQQPAEGRQRAKAGFARHKGRHFGRLAAQLNLTEQQRTQMRSIMQQARTEAAPIREQLRTNHRQLAEAVKSGNQPEIERLSTEIGTLRGQMTAIHAKAMQQGYTLLTPEQRQKADELRARHLERFQQRSGPRR